MTDKNVISMPDAQEIDSQAMHWLTRLDSGPLSPEAQLEFQDWLNTSARHKEALERMSEFWGGLEVLEQLKDYSANEVVQLETRRDNDFFHRFVRKKSVGAALAASFLAVCLYGVTQLNIFTQGAYSQQFATLVGEQSNIELPDGSKIILNTDSRISVSFDNSARQVQLLEGEAYFDVAHDPAKPFSVSTESGIVTAVGTAFSVRLHDHQINVLVTEGRVSLKSSAQELPAEKVDKGEEVRPIEVSAGQSIVFAQSANRIDVIAPAQIEKQVDWHDGFLAFKGETLEHIIGEVSRYTDMEIEISGEELRQEKIFAYYKVGNLSELFEALKLAADVEIEELNSNKVRLYHAVEEE